MSSFVTDILAPGGAILLIPYIRMVVGCLFVTTVSAFIMGVARIHMAILSFLAGGLLLSISFFVGEYERAKERSEAKSRSATARQSGEKTD